MDEECLDLTLKVYYVEKNIAIQLEKFLETPICDFCCDYSELCDSDIIPVCGCVGSDRREIFLGEESEL